MHVQCELLSINYRDSIISIAPPYTRNYKCTCNMKTFKITSYVIMSIHFVKLQADYHTHCIWSAV